MSCDGCHAVEGSVKNIEGLTDVPVEVIGWKAWYDDGRKFSGRTVEDFAGLPPDGVILVMLYQNRFSTDGKTRYRRYLSGDDFYFCAMVADGTLWACTRDTRDEIIRRYPGAVIKQGKWTTDALYRKIMDEAMIDYRVSEFGYPIEPDTTDG